MPLGASIWHSSPRIRVSKICPDVGRVVISNGSESAKFSSVEACQGVTATPTAVLKFRDHLGSVPGLQPIRGVSQRKPNKQGSRLDPR